MTLRFRLALTVALAATLAVALVAVVLFAALNRFLFYAQADRLGAAARIVQAQQDFRSGEVRLTRTSGLTGDVEARLEVLGAEVARSSAFPNVKANLPTGLYDVDGRPVLVQHVEVLGNVGTLTVTTNTRVLEAPRNAFGRALIVTAPLALLLAGLAGGFVSGRLLRPVRVLERAARRVGESGDLEGPMPGASQHDELGRLALALQEAFRAVAATRRRETDFLRAASHDLRGPLAAMRSRIGATLARPRDAAYLERELREVDADVARLGRLANHLLLLARDPGSLRFVDVDVSAIAANAVDRARERAPDTDVNLDAPKSATVRGDAVLLEQLVENLVSNALKHALGASVDVVVRAEGDAVTLSVRDDGPGVESGVLARLGEAFYRPDAARSGEGSGLGLALARRVAELHGGTLVLQSAHGDGFTATATVRRESVSTR
ncbi:HAMP domain-containing sensor histidine kinase [Deinococcus yavapaiensis]|uniref:histidine kinase n=1 Tax=Deinococcus yavapaiensis KR-236 TaxID=694435 RepID=A0A318S772_9DEIO|nr:HAMP domain-containing sensor histidine kinase [Deinococcus yavapaiensis]PYE52889.1 signal transduction histidine kinase [Deinococcus yavapaiensis KR-236]